MFEITVEQIILNLLLQQLAYDSFYLKHIVQ
jgi:hypothetical protein